MTDTTGLDVRTAARDPVAVVELSGDLDIAATTALDPDLEQRFAEHDNHVVLDLTDVVFVDSTGLSSLVRAMKTLQRGGRRLALVVAPGIVARALEVTGLERTLEVHPSRDAAVATLRDAPRIGRN